MVAIYWHEPDEGYYDLIPEDAFEHEGVRPLLEHTILSPGEEPILARCSVAVEGAAAVLNYRGKEFAEFNRDVYRGALRVRFSDERRAEISEIEWKGWNDPEFFPAPVHWTPCQTTSQMLRAGRVYTRDDLRKIFDISDATLDTGVFRPKGTKSLWLFVTEKKTKDRTQYADNLDGDILRWEGQTQGRKDDQIIGHDAAGDELLVFFRKSKRQHSGAGFRFEGAFQYLDHRPGKSSRFILQRREFVQLPAVPAFDPSGLADGRRMVLAKVAQRQGQAAFRKKLLSAYGGCCAISGCSVAAVLEAAHIHPYFGKETNDVTNGLLLRADLHTLFDLQLIKIDELRRVQVSETLRGTQYWDLNGCALRPTSRPGERASELALRWHRSADSASSMSGDQ